MANDAAHSPEKFSQPKKLRKTEQYGKLQKELRPIATSTLEQPCETRQKT